MLDLIYRGRTAIRLAGLALLATGLGVATGIDGAAGLALVGAAALVLVPVQPVVLARLRSRQGRRRAPRNGHLPGANADEVEPPSP